MSSSTTTPTTANTALMSPAAARPAASRSVSPVSSAESSSSSGALKREFENDNDDPAQANLTPSNKRAKPMSAERIARLEARQARNRASAQASRDKKKAFFNRLEVEHRMLVQENSWLKGQNQHLYQAILDFEKRLQMAEGVIDVLTSSKAPHAHGSPGGGMTLAQAQAIAQTQLASSSPEAHAPRSLSLPHGAEAGAGASRAFPPSLAGELPAHGALASAGALVTPPSAPAMNHYSALAGGFPFPSVGPTPTSVAPTDLSASSLSPGSLSPTQHVTAAAAAAAAPAQLMTGSISSSSISSLGDQTAVGDWEFASPQADKKKELVDDLLAAHARDHTHAHAPAQAPHHPPHHDGAAPFLGTAFTVSMRKFPFESAAAASAFNSPLTPALE